MSATLSWSELHREFHRRWTAAVSKPGYNKKSWQAAESSVFRTAPSGFRVSASGQTDSGVSEAALDAILRRVR